MIIVIVAVIATACTISTLAEDKARDRIGYLIGAIINSAVVYFLVELFRSYP